MWCASSGFSTDRQTNQLRQPSLYVCGQLLGDHRRRWSGAPGGNSIKWHRLCDLLLRDGMNPMDGQMDGRRSGWWDSGRDTRHVHGYHSAATSGSWQACKPIHQTTHTHTDTVRPASTSLWLTSSLRHFAPIITDTVSYHHCPVQHDAHTKQQWSSHWAFWASSVLATL